MIPLPFGRKNEERKNENEYSTYVQREDKKANRLSEK
jgi:hypothetical protein